MWGWGYSFSMWQMWQMWQMLSKCISPYAYHAYLCQNSRRIRPLRRPSTANHTLKDPPCPSLKGGNPKSPFKTPSVSPLEGEDSSLPLREGQGGSFFGRT